MSTPPQQCGELLLGIFGSIVRCLAAGYLAATGALWAIGDAGIPLRIDLDHRDGVVAQHDGTERPMRKQSKNELHPH